jgi:MoaA/NifB/PqqE/SkfB family radical SAM enzyme
MWISMPKIHKYLTTCEISIDAGTKETYENSTRLGGNWDNLISNLKFIATIPSLKKVKTSFVVQQSNYKEMGIFLNIMKEIFGIKTRVFFGKINNWGTFTSEQFEFLKIWDSKHPEHQSFLYEFNQVAKNPFVFHNLHEFLMIKKSII